MKDAADTGLIAKRHHLQFFQSTKSAFCFGGNVLFTIEKPRSFFRACTDKALETFPSSRKVSDSWPALTGSNQKRSLKGENLL
jgi:hypothetical protein